METTWLRFPALMERLKVSEATLRRWLRQGLPRVKMGRVLLFDAAEVDAWLKQHRSPKPSRKVPKPTRRKHR